MTPQEIDMQRIKEACATLGEFFDTVQIFATRLSDDEADNGGTVNIHYGRGNWFARYGQVKYWSTKQDELCRKEVQEED